jgi:hypothetical protein
VNAFGFKKQGDATYIDTYETSAAALKLFMAVRSIDCRVMDVGVGLEAIV